MPCRIRQQVQEGTGWLLRSLFDLGLTHFFFPTGYTSTPARVSVLKSFAPARFPGEHLLLPLQPDTLEQIPTKTVATVCLTAASLLPCQIAKRRPCQPAMMHTAGLHTSACIRKANGATGQLPHTQALRVPMQHPPRQHPRWLQWCHPPHLCVPSQIPPGL